MASAVELPAGFALGELSPVAGAQLRLRMTAFLNLLRDNGFLVGLEETQDCLRFAAATDLARPATLRGGLREKLLAAQNEIFEQEGWIMRGGSIVDATIVAAPSSTKNATGERDPAMRQTKKGNQWYFGMKAHIGADAGTGYVHSVTVTGANVHDLDEVVNLVRDDDEVAYTDAGYQGVDRRPEVTSDAHLSTVEFRVAARKGQLRAMTGPDRAIESRKASVRAKVEHPFLIVKRDFGFTKTRYRGLAKNRNHLHVLFASANWLMRARAVALTG